MRSRAAWLSVLLLSFAIPSHAFRMSAWVPGWDTNALTSMQANAGRLDETNPVWYEIAAGGGITKAFNAESPSMRAALSGTALIPTIQNYVNNKFDGALVAGIIADPTLRAQHAEAIAQLVVQNAFDGIDVDYENMSGTARADYTTFIQLLASKLHASNKKLSICVDAKTSDTDNWSGPAGEDWRALGAAADFIKIMGYDDHWSTSAAGPIAPLDWLDSIATYAESTIPAQKIIMGLPWYGYDWVGSVGAGVVYQDAITIAQTNGAQIVHDGNGEATFTYGAGHVVYFQDASSFAKKTSALAARHSRIGGFAVWRSGGEDPAMWTTVGQLRGGSSVTPVTPPAASFVAAGPSNVSALQGQVVRTNFNATPINGWNATATVAVQQVDAFPGLVSVTSTATATTPAVLTVVPTANAAPGDYRLNVVMTSGSITSSANITVTVQAAPAPAPSKRRAVHH